MEKRGKGYVSRSDGKMDLRVDNDSFVIDKLFEIVKSEG